MDMAQLDSALEFLGYTLLAAAALGVFLYWWA